MADPNSKQTPIPVVPRTMKIVNADGTVTRSGQLLLEQLQTSIVTTGSHWSRPDAGSVQDGAIYVESDRSVIYVNEGGAWHYLAGTMWGTLNPDESPTDLGPNDAGFDFRSTDTDPAYAPREFIWSGSMWVEATQVTYGAHVDRPPADQQTPPRTIYVESDRSGVIYQQQANEWHYLAGTMYGTLSPDTRPTDLAVNDAGFDFRSTDTNATYAPREFIWSGTQWVEATPVTYGAHADRPPADSATPPRTIYVESDRSGVIYQQQANAWHYLAGTMWGTLSPDQRPTDLGANDAGFDFRTTDLPPREFIWSGTGWVEATATAPSSVLVYATGSGLLTLTTTAQDIPGVLITLPKTGKYHVVGVIDFIMQNTDSGALLLGQLVDVTGSPIGSPLVIFQAPAPTARACVTQQWPVTATAAGQTIKLQAYKTSGTGNSLATNHSSLSAVWVNP